MFYENKFLTHFKITLYNITRHKPVIIRTYMWLFERKLNKIRVEFIIKYNTREIIVCQKKKKNILFKFFNK